MVIVTPFCNVKAKPSTPPKFWQMYIYILFISQDLNNNIICIVVAIAQCLIFLGLWCTKQEEKISSKPCMKRTLRIRYIMLVFLQTEIILKTQFEKKLHVELINRDSVCLFFNLVKNSPVFKNPLGWVRKTLKPSVLLRASTEGS